MGFLFSKFGMYLGLVVVGLIALAVIARNWSCRKSPEPTPIERTSGPYSVVSIESGASLTYEVDRRSKRREPIQESITLPFIASPSYGQNFFEESRANLESIVAGGTVTIHEQKDRRREAFEPGDCFASSGQCLQIEQLAAGWAWCLTNAPKAYQAAQKTAQKKKLGLWSNAEYSLFRLGDAE